MITIRRARERYDDRRGRQEVWFTFPAAISTEASPESFGGLTQLAEIRLPPGATAHDRRHSAELITYVLDGTLACEDSRGHTDLMHAGEFRRMTVGLGSGCNETNPSRANWTHLFRIGLGSAVLPPAHEQKRFSVAQRRDGLCLVASTAARAGSIGIREDGLVYSALLRAGQHLVHELQARRAWLHVVSGQIAVQDLSLTRGDGVGISKERSASFSAVVDSEVLLVDVA